jgi:hypothetical protein
MDSESLLLAITKIQHKHSTKQTMGLFRRRGNTASADTAPETQQLNPDVDPELQDKAQEVMKDNLELMREVVMKIREDPDFAKNIYANCPRLQHLLDQYPDLRPIFEDPKLVRINFEQVYRDAGGVLPEDEAKKTSWLVWLVNSPVFKVLRLLLFVKKIVSCIVGGGFAFVTGCVTGCCFEDALEEVDDPDDAGAEMMDPSKEALNRAADHMEDPEVQERMQALLEDPDNLQEAIENDSELRALRDSNPLCEELMSDPETMRVLTDPDNLRALGECPQLIEADFIDPDGFTPTDVETGGMEGLGDAGYDPFDGGDMEFEADNEFQADNDFEDEDDVAVDDELAAEEEDDAWWGDVEIEEQEPDKDGADNGTDAANANAARAQRAQERSEEEPPSDANNGRFGGFMATIGAVATDLIGAQIVGGVFSTEMMQGMPGAGMMDGGGGMDMGGGGNNNFDQIDKVADQAAALFDDDVADVANNVMEETTDKAGETADENASKANLDTNNDDNTTAAVAAGAAGAAGVLLVGGAVAARSRGTNHDSVQDGFADGFADEEEVEDKPERKSRFAAIARLAGAMATNAKEQVATSVLGDSWGAQLEGKGDKKDGDKKNDSTSDMSGVFQRGARKPW